MHLRRKEKAILAAVLAGAYATGAALYLLSRWVRVSTPIGEQHHPSEPWVRAFHTGATYGLVVGLGYLVKGHVLPGLRVKRRVWTGMANLTVMAILVGSALMIFYAGDSPWGGYAAQTHTLVGLVCPALLLAHAVGRPRR